MRLADSQHDSNFSFTTWFAGRARPPNAWQNSKRVFPVHAVGALQPHDACGRDVRRCVVNTLHCFAFEYTQQTVKSRPITTSHTAACDRARFGPATPSIVPIQESHAENVPGKKHHHHPMTWHFVKLESREQPSRFFGV